MAIAARARSWCRVDLAGGTLDIWPLGLLHRGASTVNFAVDLPVAVEARSAPAYRVLQGDTAVEAASAAELAAHRDGALVGGVLLALHAPPVEIRVESASPRGGGLGASSALAVAAIAAVEACLGRPASTAESRAALARDVEAGLMALPTGRQDHFPGLLGGALEIAHEPGGERVRRLEVDGEALGRSLVVAYTGESHFSAGQNWQVVRRRLDGDATTVALFDRIRDVALEVGPALEAGDLETVGGLMAAEWAARRQLAQGVSTPRLESLLAAAGDAGAWGGKACGAGGGGSLALLAPPERKAAVVERLAAEGALVLEAGLATEPLEVT